MMTRTHFLKMAGAGALALAGAPFVGCKARDDQPRGNDTKNWAWMGGGAPAGTSWAEQFGTMRAAGIDGVLLGVDDPMFFQTYAEVALMKAEAIERGYVGGNAGQAFRDGVRAALDYLSMYGSEADISASDIDAYVDERGTAYAGASTAERIRMINEQYWAATYMNHYESFANWRRSGYPDLEESPVDMEGSYPGSATAGNFIRRLTYPVSEASQNTENYEQALSQQGIENVLDARVWWDQDSGQYIGDDG